MSPTELATRESAALAAKQVTDMFGGDTGIQIPIDAPLPQIKILRETPQFEMPDGTTVKSITGHILYWHNANQYYDVEFGDGESGPPACASSNGVLADGGTDPFTILNEKGEREGLRCRVCPKNKYNSAGNGGKGKACQNSIRLYVLVDGEILPCILKAPPSSLSPKDSLMRWLANTPNTLTKAVSDQLGRALAPQEKQTVAGKYHFIKVKLSLHTKSFDQYSASCIDIETVRVLNPTDDADAAHFVEIRKLKEQFMESYFGRIRHDIGAEAQHAQEAEPDQGDGFPDDDIPL